MQVLLTNKSFIYKTLVSMKQTIDQNRSDTSTVDYRIFLIRGGLKKIAIQDVVNKKNLTSSFWIWNYKF